MSCVLHVVHSCFRWAMVDRRHCSEALCVVAASLRDTGRPLPDPSSVKVNALWHAPQAALLTDEGLDQLGRRHYNEQFDVRAPRTDRRA